MIKLIGIAIIIIGFALKFNSIATIFIAMIVTALIGGLGVEGFLETVCASRPQSLSQKLSTHLQASLLLHTAL